MCNSLGFGLALDLKKRRFFLKEDDTKDFDFLMLGSFDGLKIRKVEKLSDFIPTFEDDLGAAGIEDEDYTYSFESDYKFENEKYISTFILKLLNSGDVDLSIWCDDKEQRYCFFTMIMLNVSETAAKEYAEKGSKKLFVDIKDYIEKRILSDFEGCYDIFETFGYYDYVILIKSSNLKNIKNFSDKLSNIRIENTDKNILATVYTIFGIKNCADCEDLIIEGCKDIDSIVIDFHLNGNSIDEGDNALSFVDYLVNYMKERAEGKLDVNAYYSEGESDASIRIWGSKKGIIFKEYFNNGILNPGNSYYNENVLSMRTRILFDSILQSNNKNTENNGYKLSDRCIENFRKYVELVRTEKRIRRRTTSLRQLVQRYYNIARYDHSFEIRTLVKPVFESLFLNIEKANLYLKKEIELIENENDKNDKYQREIEKIVFWSFYDEAIDCFREEVGSFISDISLSDRYFIENSQLKHPSIGSATKLIFFYNLLVNKIVEEFNHESDDGISYNFLIKCGGGDEVKVKNIFDFLPHYDLDDEAKHQENCLLIVEIPERLLYIVSVTLCAVLHEAFHIVGNRNRRLRLKQILDGISTYLACSFTHHLKSAYYNTRNGREDIFESCKNEIEKGINEILIRKLLEKSNVDDYDKINELFMYSRKVDTVYDIVSEVLDFESVLKEESELYFLVLDNWSKINFETLKNDEIKTKKDWPKNIVIDLSVKRYIAQHDLDNRKYSINLIERFISILMEISENIKSDIEIFIDAFLENYPELMAISILKMDIEDFLIYLCFLKESSEEELIVMDEGSVLRYGSIIDFKYRNNIEIKSDEDIFRLNDETRDRFRYKLNMFRKKGLFPEQKIINEDILLERMDELLRKYYQNYSPEGYYGNGFAISIKKYLQQIAEKNNFQYDIVKVIQDLYNKFNSEIVLGEEASDKCLAEMIMDNWLKLTE